MNIHYLSYLGLENQCANFSNSKWLRKENSVVYWCL